MLTELHGKGGRLCEQARTGGLRCPLMVRPTSEDVVTGQMFQALGCINSRWWLPDLLNAALGSPRFRRQVHRRLRIGLWKNQPSYPRQLLPWDEGSTQVDVVITWENPPTTVFIEAKYGSQVSETSANADDDLGFPSDQLVRNIRVGLLACGYLDGGGSLFDGLRRDFVQVLLQPRDGHPLVERYRDAGRLVASIPHSDRLVGLPRPPFVGHLSYSDVVGVLADNVRFMNRAERQVAEDLSAYLDFKRALLPSRPVGFHARTESVELFDLRDRGPARPAGEVPEIPSVH